MSEELSFGERFASNVRESPDMYQGEPSAFSAAHQLNMEQIESVFRLPAFSAYFAVAGSIKRPDGQVTVSHIAGSPGCCNECRHKFYAAVRLALDTIVADLRARGLLDPVEPPLGLGQEPGP